VDEKNLIEKAHTIFHTKTSHTSTSILCIFLRQLKKLEKLHECVCVCNTGWKVGGISGTHVQRTKLNVTTIDFSFSTWDWTVARWYVFVPFCSLLLHVFQMSVCNLKGTLLWLTSSQLVYSYGKGQFCSSFKSKDFLLHTHQ